ncbi:malto-oligosyltrehalose trehalohydrolase [Methylomonas sp. MgM2]
MSNTDNKPVHRHHSMPFGAELLCNGRTRFRLWAPAARRVDICFLENDRELLFSMDALPGGWFELTPFVARAGTRYLFRIDDRLCVPDPASRQQADDVHGCSIVVDTGHWSWTDQDWRGRPWEETVIYELHVGTFSPEGTYRAVADKLDHLVSLGVTAIELMPIAEFPGRHDWGYDGVLPFAPSNSYGSPDDLKYLIQTAHAKGMMMFLDVVYNHFGPEGNYLHHYAPDFFNSAYHTPWGAAINFDGENSDCVRRYFIHNALYWLEEFHFDGLRLDAVHSIFDKTQPDILEELADAILSHFGRFRHIHLILENDHNAAHYLRRDNVGKPLRYAAQWNDDIHHVLHVLLTGEKQGYYVDYTDAPISHLGRCLTEGFAYQGESSIYRNGENRGELSCDLSPLAFVSFLQNHDQVGNRALAERISVLAPEQAIRAATALLLLAPFPPLLFMGQEWGSRQPFAFFCDFEPELAQKVNEGRRLEFNRFFGFADDGLPITDPSSETAFINSVLDWETVNATQGTRWLEFHKNLLKLRHREIIPRLSGMRGRALVRTIGQHALKVCWRLSDDSELCLITNLSAQPIALNDKPQGRLLFVTPNSINVQAQTLPGWSTIWTLKHMNFHAK